MRIRLAVLLVILGLGMGMAFPTTVQLAGWTEVSMPLAMPMPNDFFHSLAEFFRGIWNGIKSAAEGDYDSTVDCIYGFECSINAIGDFIYYLQHVQKFDFEEALEKFIEYVVIGVFNCLYPCTTPAYYLAHFVLPFLIVPTKNLPLVILLMGFAIGAQQMVMNFIDFIEAASEGDFFRMGTDVGDAFYAVIIR